MPSSTYAQFQTKKTSQSEPIPGQTQVKNNAGGFVYALGNWGKLQRFLILGSEGGTYYVAEQPLTKDNALGAMACIQEDGKRAVDMVVDISQSGRAPKNDPAIFVLALAASATELATRQYALSRLSEVCRIPTHLYHFNDYCKGLRGWGRTLKRANGDWFQETDVEKLAYHMVKYQQRDGWSARDILRKVHIKTREPKRNALYRWITQGVGGEKGAMLSDLPKVVQAFEEAKSTTEVKGLIRLIESANLSREMIPTQFLTEVKVQEALLQKQPYIATIRNLGNYGKSGLLKPLSDAEDLICDRILDMSQIQQSKVHPIAILMAQKVYASGHSVKGSGIWTPSSRVVDALDEAFYKSFQFQEPTGKKFLIGVDVSGSMHSARIADLPMSAAEGAVAMAMCIARVEPKHYIHGFTAGPGNRSEYSRFFKMQNSQTVDGFVDLGISNKTKLADALAKTRSLTMGPTDCAVPALWALKNNINVDCIVIITDNETWAGKIHPSQALKQLRQQTGTNVKQIVVGMTATGFTIADPNDPYSLDVVGFSADVPQVIQEFAKN